MESIQPIQPITFDISSIQIELESHIADYKKFLEIQFIALKDNEKAKSLITKLSIQLHDSMISELLDIHMINIDDDLISDCKEPNIFTRDFSHFPDQTKVSKSRTCSTCFNCIDDRPLSHTNCYSCFKRGL